MSAIFNILLTVALIIGCISLNKATRFTSQITQVKEVETVEIDVLVESRLW